MNALRRFLPLIVAVLIAAAHASCGKPALEKVVIAEGSQPAGAALYAAVENGFFERYGLDVEVVNHAYGSMAVDAMFAGEADFAVAAETPFVRSIMNQQQPRLLATIGKSIRYYAVVALRTQQIQKPADLRGKHIGVTRGSTGEYFLNLLLNLHGLKNDEVTLVHLIPREMPEALVEGKVDALATWDFVIDSISSEAALTRIEVNGILDFVWNLIGTHSYLTAHPETGEKLLRGLRDGQRWCEDNQDACIEKVMRRTQFQEDSVRRHWDKQELRLGLSQSLLINCENQLRWLAQDNEEILKRVNILDYFDTSSLRKVEPDSVSLIE